MISIFIVETAEDGSEDIFGPSVTRAMKLPFRWGWEKWRLYDGDTIVAEFPSYQQAWVLANNLNQFLKYKKAA